MVAFEEAAGMDLKESKEKCYWKLEERGYCSPVAERLATLLPARPQKVENMPNELGESS